MLLCSQSRLTRESKCALTTVGGCYIFLSGRRGKRLGPLWFLSEGLTQSQPSRCLQAMKLCSCSGVTALLLIVFSLAALSKSQAQILFGQVVSEVGRPLLGVEVYGVSTKCCRRPAATLTDARGRFRLKRPGVAIHLRRTDLAPQTVLLHRHTTVRVVMENEERSTKVLPVCASEPTHRYGYRMAFFTNAPIRKSPDVDYEMFHLNGPGGGMFQAWFGGSASSVDPFDPSGQIYSAATEVHERFVRDPHHGIIGIESSGTYLDGRHWRWLGVQPEPAPIRRSLGQNRQHSWSWNGLTATAQIGYLKAEGKDQSVFDPAIDSACMIRE